MFGIGLASTANAMSSTYAQYCNSVGERSGCVATLE